MDLDKSKSRGITCDMSPSAVERRLEIVDELRELALELGQAERLGRVVSQPKISETKSARVAEKPQS